MWRTFTHLTVQVLAKQFLGLKRAKNKQLEKNNIFTKKEYEKQRRNNGNETEKKNVTE